MSIRLDYLEAKLRRFLDRYTPPKDLGPQAQADEIGALLRALDRAAPQRDYDGWWAKFEDMLAEGLRTRAWPIVGDIARASQRMPSPKATATDQERPHIYEIVREWWIKFRDAGPRPIAKEHHGVRLQAEGLATWGQLRRGGFIIPDWAKDAAKDEPDPNHEAILADIRALGQRLKADGAPRGNVVAAFAKAEAPSGYGTSRAPEGQQS